MNLTGFLSRLSEEPESITFSETLAVIDNNYIFSPIEFHSGIHKNAPGKHTNACKIFAFALLHGLSARQTLACFGEFYREDVLGNPTGKDHPNLREFSRKGWNGLYMDGEPLTPLHQEQAIAS